LPGIILLDEPADSSNPFMTNVIADLIVRNARTECDGTVHRVKQQDCLSKPSLPRDDEVASPPPGEIAHADNAIVEHFINKWKMEQAAT